VFAACGPSSQGQKDATPVDDIQSIDAQTEFTDFPTDPIVEGGLTGVPTTFPTGTGASPCVSDPAPDALYPRNWLRPRFTWTVDTGHNVSLVRLTVANQVNPLVVITPNTQWAMPKSMWMALALHSPGHEVNVTVQSGTWDGTTLSATSTVQDFKIRIAPVDAQGSIIYWTTTSKSLKGFKPGDEDVSLVLQPTQVQGRAIDCVGCHVTTPDGDYLGFATKLEGANPDPSTAYAVGVTPTAQGQVGSAPSFIGAGGAQAMLQPWRGLPAFSAAHWSPTERVLISTKAGDVVSDIGELQKIDLTAATMGAAITTLARTGDPGIPAMATWSHSGTSITYASVKTMVDARPSRGPGDLYTVPYANGAGGTAVKVPGASTAEYEENYPSYSPDDQFLSFTRVPKDDEMLFSANKEVFVVPSAGGTPIRLAANDPPACVGRPSPGVWNSFAKWSPDVGLDDGGTRYYWQVFSSKRDGTGRSKLYLSALVVPPSGAPMTTGAIDLWNQPDEDNHTPSWDRIKGLLQ
jgi:hypothetical protein